eukprot:TRINITY_DN2660_c0_g1_i1.p1 TRINITY_DN2660_c0_g1~~TRINITY_DN2660_c0_g1_i1.p1  ORF type:complete len:178 (+),score=40.81 TRINITY_DN2660_c0_g1_i1:125-658(+)
MESIHMDRVQWEELDILVNVVQTTFVEAFAHCNTQEDMEDYKEKGLNKTVIEKEWKDPNSIYVFARSSEGNQILGYLKVNFGDAQNEIRDPDAMEIQRLYVLKEHQNKKIGGKMIDWAMQMARDRTSPVLRYVWLGVWEHNKSAIRFYERLGFVIFDQHHFMLGQDDQIDLLMKKTI